MMASVRYTDLALYRRIWRQSRSYRLHIGGLFLLSLLSTPLALLAPLPLKIAVDSVIGSHPVPRFLDSLLPAAASQSKTAVLILAAVLLVAIVLTSQLQGLGISLLRTYTGEKLVLNFRANLFRHVQRLSISYHESRGATDSTYRIQYDAPAIQWVAIDGLIPFITAGFALAGMLWVTARIDLQLALVALVISPILLLVSQAYGPRLRSKWHEVYRLQSSAMAVVQEVVAAVRVVKAFGQEDREQKRFIHHAREGLCARIRVAIDEGGFGLLVGLITAVGTASVLLIGTRHVQSGVLTLGELLLVVAYVSQLYGPLQTLSSMVAHLQGSRASAERAFSLVDESPDVAERQNASPVSRVAGAVSFQNVSFTYEKHRPVLHDISFEIGPGTRVGIMGATGAGKTTLVGLLNRFYDPTEGRILLDGVDLRDYRLADLRHQFAIVLQEPVLFSTSIAENIAYARPSADHQDIVTAAKAANAHEFIVGLPQGYETRVGERGLRLSGGERQRVSLARAFLKAAPILILDEPTSAVDVRSEATILEAMERLMQGRTTFVIAHRPTTLKNCDTFLLIEDGRLVKARSVATETAGAGTVS